MITRDINKMLAINHAVAYLRFCEREITNTKQYTIFTIGIESIISVINQLNTLGPL